MILLLKNFILIPEFFFCLSFICLLLYGTILSTTLKKNQLIIKPLINISILILIFSNFLFCNNFYSIDFNSTFFFNSIIIDYFSEFSKIFISIVTILCFCLFRFYLPIQKINTFEYIIILLLALLGVFLLCSANDLLTAYLSIELQSLAFYILASYKKKSSFSVNVGLKYFILGAIASCLFLFSTSLLYGITGSINLEDIWSILSLSGVFELYNCCSFYFKQITCYNMFGFCYLFNLDIDETFISSNYNQFINNSNEIISVGQETQSETLNINRNDLIVVSSIVDKQSFEPKWWPVFQNAQYIEGRIITRSTETVEVVLYLPLPPESYWEDSLKLGRFSSNLNDVFDRNLYLSINFQQEQIILPLKLITFRPSIINI